jgi:hypothetical protein
MYVPNELQALFWDTDLTTFDPHEYPDYTIFRVLEHGDTHAVRWLESAFRQDEICRVLRSERRLTPKSATFWALVYGVPPEEVAALQAAPDPQAA